MDHALEVACWTLTALPCYGKTKKGAAIEWQLNKKNCEVTCCAAVPSGEDSVSARNGVRNIPKAEWKRKDFEHRVEETKDEEKIKNP